MAVAVKHPLLSHNCGLYLGSLGRKKLVPRWFFLHRQERKMETLHGPGLRTDWNLFILCNVFSMVLGPWEQLHIHPCRMLDVRTSSIPEAWARKTTDSCLSMLLIWSKCKEMTMEWEVSPIPPSVLPRNRINTPHL